MAKRDINDSINLARDVMDTGSDSDVIFNDLSDNDDDWNDLLLNEDGQQLIPIQQTPKLTLAKVLKSINLPPDTNLDEIPFDVLSKCVETMPQEIFEQLEQKYGKKRNRDQQKEHRQTKCNIKMKRPCEIDTVCNVGDEINYQCKGQYKHSNEWHEGSGIVLDIYRLNGMNMIKVKLAYGTMTLVQDKIIITKNNHN